MNVSEILDGQSGLAGIQQAVSGSTSRGWLRRDLGKLLEDGYRLGPLRLKRVKYKPGRRLTAYYEALVCGPGGLGRIRPAAVDWGEPRGNVFPTPEALEMQEEIRQTGLMEPFRQLWTVVPTPGLRVQVWPLDPAFSQLKRLADPGYFRQIVGDPEGCSKDFTWQVHPIRYRPGERHVLQYEVSRANQTGKPSLLYAKLYRKGEDAGRAERIATRVVDWLAKDGHGVGGVRPVGWLREDAVVFYPHAPGTPLSHLLTRPNARLDGLLANAGAALRTLHEGPQALTEDLEPNPFDQEAKVVARATEHIRALLPEVGDQISRMLEEAGRLNADLPGEALTFTHSDFKADHLLVSPMGVTIIDFDTCALAEPSMDVGKFLADLEWWFLLAGRPGSGQAQDAFLRGYAAEMSAERMARARLYEALILIKIAARRPRLFDHRWPELVMRTVGRAEEVLREVGVKVNG